MYVSGLYFEMKSKWSVAERKLTKRISLISDVCYVMNFLKYVSVVLEKLFFMRFG